MTEATHPNVGRLCAFIEKAVNERWPEPDLPPIGVNVYLFRDEDGGIRIAEISLVRRYPNGSVGGSSYMGSVPESANVLFAAERFLLFANTPVLNVDSWESDLDEGQEHEQRLYFALTGEWPEWEDRAATHNYIGPNEIEPIT